MSSDAEADLARAWIIARDDLDDATRIDSVRVAADRLQAGGHPLGELVTLGLALLESTDAAARASLRVAYMDRVAALLPEALGPFATLMTRAHAFDMRWSLCYLEGARLPLGKARRYAGLLGVSRLDPAAMLAMFLDQPGARCIRSLTLDLGREAQVFEVLSTLSSCAAPIESVSVVTSEPQSIELPSSVVTMPYLHTLCLCARRVGFGSELEHLPGGDPDVAWTGDAASIRALGRAATGHDPAGREQALARIRRMSRNSGRYLAAIQASEPHERRWGRVESRELLAYAREASSLERQREQFERDGVHPRWALRARWRELVPNGAWINDLTLRAHNQLHDSPRLELLTIAELHDDPDWIEFRRQAELIAAQISSS